MAKVDILLATYNGAKYIRSQIMSIIGQSFEDWRLIIHDDGSTDETVAIIKRIVDPRIVLIEDEKKFGNPCGNFLYLTQFIESPYAMFCDQDDIWLDNKVEILYDAIQSYPTDEPVVGYSQSYLWIPKTGITGMGAYTKFNRTLNHLLFNNGGIQGCAAIFNKKAGEYLMNYRGRDSMHDHLLNIVGLAFGKVFSIDLPLMLYRQHGDNQTGISRYNYSLWRRILLGIKMREPVIDKRHYETIQDFYAQYRSVLPDEKRRVFEAYLNMPLLRLFQKLIAMVKFDFRREGSLCKLLVKTMIHPFIQL